MISGSETCTIVPETASSLLGPYNISWLSSEAIVALKYASSNRLHESTDSYSRT